MRSARKKFVSASTILLFGLMYLGMLPLSGGCAPEDTAPIPQESPEEELWSEREDEASSALLSEEEFTAASAGEFTYDRAKALWYIRRFAREPNTNFAYCGDWQWDGETNKVIKVAADCTNFASQVLWHGGLKMRTASSADDGWWSKGGCRSWSSSASWRQVFPLIHELLSVSRVGQVVQDVRQLQIGDLIFYRLRTEENGYVCPQEAVYNHATVVSGFGEDREPLVSYHSNDSLDIPWDSRSDNPGSLGRACGVLLVHIR